ncbi:unnamed protein product [Sympodiomycopsis kandeliae]
MRFRTTLEDINTLTRIIQTIHKVSPRCIIRLEPNDVRFICTSESSSSAQGIQIWSQISVDSFFKDYRVESNFNNQINFEVSTDTLLQALRSGVNAIDVMMRLAKRDKEPLLSFAIANASHSGSKIEIVQDVLIKVLRPAESARIKEPLCPDPDVHIFLPKLYKVRTVAERMKAVSNHIYISANHQSEFRMSVEQPEIQMETTWKKCGHPAINKTVQEQQQQQPRDPAAHFRVKLDAKSLLKFLGSHIVESRTIACICSGHCAIFYVYVGDPKNTAGVMTFFLPASEED